MHTEPSLHDDQMEADMLSENDRETHAQELLYNVQFPDERGLLSLPDTHMEQILYALGQDDPEAPSKLMLALVRSIRRPFDDESPERHERSVTVWRVKAEILLLRGCRLVTGAPQA